MEKLSVYVLTLNEQARLPRTLEAARQVADEIIDKMMANETKKNCQGNINFGLISFF